MKQKGELFKITPRNAPAKCLKYLEIERQNVNSPRNAQEEFLDLIVVGSDDFVRHGEFVIGKTCLQVSKLESVLIKIESFLVASDIGDCDCLPRITDVRLLHFREPGLADRDVEEVRLLRLISRILSHVENARDVKLGIELIKLPFLAEISVQGQA